MNVGGETRKRPVVAGHPLAEALCGRDVAGLWQNPAFGRQSSVFGEETPPGCDRVALPSRLTEGADPALPAHGPQGAPHTGAPVVEAGRADRPVATGREAGCGGHER